MQGALLREAEMGRRRMEAKRAESKRFLSGRAVYEYLYSALKLCLQAIVVVLLHSDHDSQGTVEKASFLTRRTRLELKHEKATEAPFLRKRRRYASLPVCKL